VAPIGLVTLAVVWTDRGHASEARQVFYFGNEAEMQDWSFTFSRYQPGAAAGTQQRCFGGADSEKEKACYRTNDAGCAMI